MRSIKNQIILEIMKVELWEVEYESQVMRDYEVRYKKLDMRN